MLAACDPTLGSGSDQLETRPYFVFGDLATNCVAGVFIAMISAAVFGPSWNMLVAMFVGMAMGMALAMPFALAAGALFGAMEVMLPVMTTGMVAGMIVSMAAAMGDIGFAWAARAGAYSGIVVVVATYVANAWIKRKASQWTS